MIQFPAKEKLGIVSVRGGATPNLSTPIFRAARLPVRSFSEGGKHGEGRIPFELFQEYTAWQAAKTLGYRRLITYTLPAKVKPVCPPPSHEISASVRWEGGKLFRIQSQA